MRRPFVATVATIALLATAPGCVVRGKGRYEAYAVDVAAMSLGILIAASAGLEDDRAEGDYVNPEPINNAISAAGGVLAAAGLIGALVNYQVNDSALSGRPVEAPAPPPIVAEAAVDAPLPQPAWASPEAVRMTQQARRAASRGACQAVDSLAVKVLAADPRYFQQVFAFEPAMAGCLAATGWRRVDTIEASAR